MAILRHFRCVICGEDTQEARSSSDHSFECYACQSKAKDKAEREWKAGREGLTLEERVRELEHFMYHHSRHEHYSGPTVFG